MARQRPTTTSRTWTRAAYLAVAVLAALAYVNSLTNGWVFDDRLLIERNPVVQGQAGVREVLLAPYYAGVHRTATGLYRPLTLLSLFLDHRWSGLEPWGYHLANVALHVLVSLLVLALGRRLGLGAIAALGGALLFAIHPLHTEVVANVAGRAELLCAVFFLAALLAYVAAREREAGASVLAALAGGSFLLALLSKENAVTLLGVVPAWEWTRPSPEPFARPRWRGALRAMAPLAIAAGAYLVLRAASLGGAFAGPHDVSAIDNPLVNRPLAVRWATAAVVAVRYLVLSVFPARLSADYSYAQILPVGPTSLAALGAIAILAVVAAAAVLWARGRPAIAFLVAFVVITFSVTSNVFVVIGTIMAERLLYLPSVGICLLGGCAFAALARSAGSKPAWAVLLVLLGLGAGRTVVRNRDWHDNLTLFTSAARVSPRSVKVQGNLGAELIEAGRYDEARQALEEALRIAPDYDTARVNLAHVLMEQGDLEGAERQLRKVLASKPRHGLARLQLGELLLRRGRLGEAEDVFRELLRIEPDSAPVHARLGAVLTARGQAAEAERELREAVRLDPRSTAALNDLGLLYQHTGRAGEAVEVLKEAVRLSPEAVPLANNLGNALREAGRLDESREVLEHAARLEPGLAATHYNLGLTLERAGDAAGARGQYLEARRLDPGHGGAARALGRLALGARDFRRALDYLDDAVRIDDKDEEAVALRGRTYLALGRYPDAEADYRRVLELNPSSVAARNNLGIIHALRGDRAGARRWWEEALRLAPDSREIRDNLRKLDADGR